MDKLASMLGFAAKAGKLLAGTASVENAIKKRKVYLVICAQDLSPKTIKNFQYMCQANGIEFRNFGLVSELGKWTGFSGRGVYGVTSIQFVQTLRSLFNDGGDDHK